jgi:hypothetical protein
VQDFLARKKIVVVGAGEHRDPVLLALPHAGLSQRQLSSWLPAAFGGVETKAEGGQQAPQSISSWYLNDTLIFAR